MDSFWIFLKTALRILSIFEIYIKQMVIFQMQVEPYPESFWFPSFGSICAENGSKMESFWIFWKMAQMILCISEIYMKQMVIFQTQVEPYPESFWFPSFGSIFAENGSKMDSFWIFLKTVLRILSILEIYMKQMIIFQMQVEPYPG